MWQGTSFVGMIAPFGTNKVPQGWLACNGATLNAVNDPTFWDLWLYLGTAWGGSSSSSFKIPDLRGEFIRGWDAGRGADSGRGLNSHQGDAMRQLTGWIQSGSNSTGSGGCFWGARNGGGERQGYWNGVRFWFAASRQVPTAGEVRVRNRALQFCIRY